ncbi:MAG: hypothetical protein ACJ79H_17590 [Myxococcales bacterium]
MSQRKAPTDPTLRELRATLGRLWHEIDNHGRDTELGRVFKRTYDQMAFLLDAYLFDVDPDADDGGRS